MQRIPVESTDIVSIGYDAKTRVLEIEFKENRTYQYFDVAPTVHEQLMRADSYGAFFFASISKHYRYERLKSAEAPAAALDKLAFVSGDADKLRDFQAVCQPLSIEIEQLNLPIDEIQSHEAERVIAHKAKQAYKLAGRPVVVEDTFWNILALRGFPGAYMRYVSEWFKPEDFLALMHGKPDRTIIRTHSVAYYDGKHLKVWSKDFTGTMTTEPRGRGAAIDQLVITAGETRTNAEIRQAEGRSSISPEDSAWHAFAKWYNLRRRLGRV